MRALLALCLVLPQVAHAEVGGNWMGGGRNSLLYGYAQPVPASGCFPSTNAVLTLDASDLTTLYTDIAGTTNVTTDGDPVGMWKDKNGNGFDLTAQADDTTRPTYHTSGGLHWVTFDGTNDILKRGAYLGLASAAHTIAVALRHDAAAQGSVITEKNVADPEVEYRPMRNFGSDFNDIQAWLRIADGNYRLNNVQIADEGFPTTTDVSVIITNSTTSIQAHVDGAAQTAQGFTAFSSTNPDVFGLGGTWRTTASDLYAGRISYVKIYSDVKSGGDLTTIDTCLKATQGR